MLRCSASGAKGRDGRRLKVGQRFQEELSYRGMFIDDARRLQHRCFSAGIGLTAIAALEVQGALTQAANLTKSAAMAGVEVHAKRPPSSSVLPDDEEHWMMSDLVDVDAKKRVEVKRRPRYLQESCRDKRRKVAESVVEAVGLAVELVDDVAVALLDAIEVVDPRIDELSVHLASLSLEVTSFTSKLYGLEEVRDEAKLKYEELLVKVRAEAETSRKHIGASYDGALSRYHGFLWSI